MSQHVRQDTKMGTVQWEKNGRLVPRTQVQFLYLLSPESRRAVPPLLACLPLSHLGLYKDEMRLGETQCSCSLSLPHPCDLQQRVLRLTDLQLSAILSDLSPSAFSIHEF